MSKISYPAWKDFQLFEKTFEETLARIDTLRRGGVEYRAQKWPISGAPRGGKMENIPSSDYSPEIVRLITEASVSLSQGDIGNWLSDIREFALKRTITALHKNCGLPLGIGPTPEIVTVSQQFLDEVRKFQILERELRFLGRFAIIFGQIHWNGWISCNKSAQKLVVFEEANRSLAKSLKAIMNDRYLYRRLSPQDLAATATLQKLLTGLTVSLEYLAPDGAPIHPYKRFHADGRGIRMEIGVEILQLCQSCFGRCPKNVLVKLIETSEMQVPSKFDDWIRELLIIGKSLTRSYERAQHLYTPLLPINLPNDDRSPFPRVSPWLCDDIHSLRIIKGNAATS